MKPWILYSSSKFSSQGVQSDDVLKDVIPNMEISVIDKGKGKKVKAKYKTTKPKKVQLTEYDLNGFN